MEAGLRRPAVVAGGAAVAAAYVAAADPAGAARLPTLPCPIHATTGLWCPGCGMTRAVHDVVTGHPLAAFGHNLLWPLVVALLVWTSAAWLWPGVASPARVRPAVWASLIVGAAAFGVLRNLPAFSALAP